MVGQGQIRPLADKVQALHQYTPPQSRKQLRAILHLAGYYQRFIPQFGEVTAPLTDLLQGRGRGLLMWHVMSRQAFEKTKNTLCRDVILETLDFESPFVLQMNASDKALGTVLLQETDGISRPVAYASRKLNPMERQYATVERECLAIKWGINYF